MTQDDLRRALNALGRIPVERVEEIMQAERDGRLVVLPCKVACESVERDKALARMEAEVECTLEKAQKRTELLEGAIDRQNNTIDYLNSMSGQGFNW